MGIICFFRTLQTSDMRMSVMSDALKNIVNAEKAGKRQVMIRPVSKVVVKFLRVMQKHGYINAFEIIDDARNGKIVIDLIGRLNKCGVISPRFDLKFKNFEKFVYQILPSRQFGYVVLTTNKGIMDHIEARNAHIGVRSSDSSTESRKLRLITI